MDNQNEVNTLQSHSGNQKLIVGLIVGILTGLVIAFYLLDYFPVVSTTLINVLIAIFVMTVIVVLAFIWFKNRILAWFFGEDFRIENSKEELKNLYDQISQQYVGKLLEGFPKDTQKEAKLAAPRLLKLALWSFTRSWALRLVVAIFVAIGGLLGAILLYNQNQLLLKQNERIEIQNNLIESERRGSVIFLMSNILDKIDEELKSDFGDDKVRNLSDELIGRIAALSLALKPYKYLNNDSLTNTALSPERGQLLIALANSNLDSISQKKLFSKCTFAYAELSKLDLKRINLRGANLQEADLTGVNLSFADLRGANLQEADLTGANLYGANLRKITWVATWNDETGSHGTGGIITANLRGAILNGADLRVANLSGANMKLSNLKEANMSRADLQGVAFEQADLRGAVLIEAKVSSKEWFTLLKDKVIGIENLQKIYHIDTFPYKNPDFPFEYSPYYYVINKNHPKVTQ